MTDRVELPREPLGGRYLVERLLGRGAMAVVYAAHDLERDRAVAIKVLHGEFARVVGAERFRREIALLGRLIHPHIMPLLDTGQAEGLPYYVMPLAGEGSLRQRLARQAARPFAEVLAVAQGVGAALDHAHAAGVLHRDIKPGNIVFERSQALVCDFGVARAIQQAGGESLSSSGLVVGTPTYMSPEQAAGGPLDGRADLYALGCVLYEMVTGEPPFSGATVQAVLARHVSEPPPSPRILRPDTPAALERALAAALAKNPGDRPETGAILSTSLELA